MGQRTPPLLSPTYAELKTGRGKDISIPLLMQILPLHIEKEKSELVDDNPEIHISSIEK